MGLDARTIRSCTVQSNYFFSNLILWQILSVFAGVSDVLRRMSGSTVIRRVDAAVIYSVPDLPKIVVVPRFFVTFLICEASAFVETSMFSNMFDASGALPDDGYAKGPWHHVRHGVPGQSRHRQQREAIEGDQVCALGARWHRCWAGTTARRSIQRRHRRQVVSHTRSFIGTFALSADEFLVTWAGLAVTPSHDPTYIQAITQTSQSIRQSVAGNTIAGQ